MYDEKFYIEADPRIGEGSLTLYMYNEEHTEMGRIGAIISNDHVLIDKFAIKKCYRGKGYGRKLFEEFERCIKDIKMEDGRIISQIIVYPSPDEFYEEENYIPVPLDDLIKIYEALGFKENEKYRDTTRRQMVKDL